MGLMAFKLSTPGRICKCFWIGFLSFRPYHHFIVCFWIVTFWKVNYRTCWNLMCLPIESTQHDVTMFRSTMKTFVPSLQGDGLPLGVIGANLLGFLFAW